MRLRLGEAFASLAQLDPARDIPLRKRSEFKSLLLDLDKRIDLEDKHWLKIRTAAPKSDKMAQVILDQFVEVMGGL